MNLIVKNRQNSENSILVISCGKKENAIFEYYTENIIVVNIILKK